MYSYKIKTTNLQYIIITTGQLWSERLRRSTHCINEQANPSLICGSISNPADISWMYLHKNKD